MSNVDLYGRYRAENAANLIVRALDGLTLIYHRRSGVTHMVSTPVPEILAALGTDILAPAQILAQLSRVFDVEAEEAESLHAVLVARLEELAVLGLVERL